MNKKKLQVFLFTDALMFTKPKGKNKLKYKGLVLLSTSTLNVGKIAPVDLLDMQM